MVNERRALGDIAPQRASAQHSVSHDVARAMAARHGSATTRGALLIALSPILLQIPVVLIGALGAATNPATVWVAAAFALLFCATLNYLFALLDIGLLTQRGYAEPAPALLAVVPLAYLWVRARRLHAQAASGFRALWVHVAALLVLFTLFVASGQFWSLVFTFIVRVILQKDM